MSTRCLPSRGFTDLVRASALSWGSFFCDARLIAETCRRIGRSCLNNPACRVFYSTLSFHSRSCVGVFINLLIVLLVALPFADQNAFAGPGLLQFKEETLIFSIPRGLTLTAKIRSPIPAQEFAGKNSHFSLFLVDLKKPLAF